MFRYDKLDVDKMKYKYPMLSVAIIEGICGYVNDHRPVGSFLTAVISNNLKEAFMRADDNNVKHMFDVVKLFYNEVPSPCWGSYKEMIDWLSPHVERRASKTGGNYAGNKD